MPRNTETAIVGIDLGTTRSAIAHLDEYGRPQTITNSEGELTTPSAVLFDDGEVLVGKEAIKASVISPDQVAQFVKRETGNKDFSFCVDGKHHPAELIQSFLLSKLRHDAERSLGKSVNNAVVTVPAFFNEPKRRATINACELAGINVTSIINEPTAAAIAFGASNGMLNEEGAFAKQETVLVYDLGGGTFDVSLLKIKDKTIDVIGIDGNARLGGLDWDKCIVDWLAEQFQSQFGISMQDDAAAQTTLRREAEEIKHTLSAKEKASVKIRLFDQILNTEMLRSEFEERTAHLLDRTRFTITKLFQDNNFNWLELDRILLVGGSTRMPQVATMLESTFMTTIDRSSSPDQSVAHGAAIYCGLIANKTEKQVLLPEISVSDVCSHQLGVQGVEISTGLPKIYVMIRKNSPLPAKHKARFHTVVENQPNVIVKITEGGDMLGQSATRLGSFVVRDLPQPLPVGSPIDVVLRYTRDGMLKAEATIVASGKKTSLTLDHTSGLTSEQMTELREDNSDIYAALGLDT